MFHWNILLFVYCILLLFCVFSSMFCVLWERQTLVLHFSCTFLKSQKFYSLCKYCLPYIFPIIHTHSNILAYLSILFRTSKCKKARRSKQECSVPYTHILSKFDWESWDSLLYKIYIILSWCRCVCVFFLLQECCMVVTIRP